MPKISQVATESDLDLGPCLQAILHMEVLAVVTPEVFFPWCMRNTVIL